jgi:hypothetical protein
VADYRHRKAMKAREAADHSRVVCKSAVAMYLLKILEESLYEIERIRALRVARQLNPLKSRSHALVLAR